MLYYVQIGTLKTGVDMKIINQTDMILVAVGVVLLLWNNKFREKIRHIVPIAILYEISRLLDFNQHFDTNYVYNGSLVSFRWLLAGTLFWFNRTRLSTIFIALGSFLNMTVILANHFEMPVNYPEGTSARSYNVGRAIMNPHTHLNLLGDWIYFSHLHQLLSIGDIFISGGVILIFFYYIWLKLVKKTV